MLWRVSSQKRWKTRRQSTPGPHQEAAGARIRLKYATIQFTSWGCKTTFEDGAEANAIPHQIPHYYVVSHRLGYGDDLLGYTREHEFSHSFLEERLYDRPSRVLWGVARGELLSGLDACYEEMAAQNFQRFLRANERPIVSGVDWDSLRRDALALLSIPL